MANLGTDSLTVEAWDGTTLEGQWDLTGISHNKDDKFAIIASSNQLFTEIVLTAATGSGIFETKQIEFSGIPGVVPEPATWAMMLLGFAGLGFMGLRSAGRRRTACDT
jgi:PEP-CTERM motif